MENTFSESKKEYGRFEDCIKKYRRQLTEDQRTDPLYRTVLANKSIYTQFCKSRNKGWFRKEHYAEIALYESARKFLLEHSVDGKLPSLNLLKTEKVKLLEEKKSASESYRQCMEYQKELYTICSNVDAILGKRLNDNRYEAEIKRFFRHLLLMITQKAEAYQWYLLHP